MCALLMAMVLAINAALRFILMALAIYFFDGLPSAVSATTCSGLFKATQISRRESPTEVILEKNEHNGAEVIALLSREAKLKRLFASSAGVMERYSVKQHTLRVFDVFVDQYSAYQRVYGSPKVTSDIRLFATLKFAIALHDIGKPLAILASRNSFQHEYTIPILEKALIRYGFSERESRLAKALVGNDILGHFVKGEIDAAEARAQLVAVAEQSGLSVKEYVPLQFLFYVSDAASYPFLYYRVFEVRDGLLAPKGALFQELWTQLKEM